MNRRLAWEHAVADKCGSTARAAIEIPAGSDRSMALNWRRHHPRTDVVCTALRTCLRRRRRGFSPLLSIPGKIWRRSASSGLWRSRGRRLQLRLRSLRPPMQSSNQQAEIVVCGCLESSVELKDRSRACRAEWARGTRGILGCSPLSRGTLFSIAFRSHDLTPVASGS